MGDPYSAAAYDRNHEAAVRRIGLEYGKEHGTTTHGLRHMYGQTLADLKVPPSIIMRAMHHRSYLSQLIYTEPSAARINATLTQAFLDITAGAEPGVGGHRVRDAAESHANGDQLREDLFRLSERLRSGAPR